MRPAGWLTGPCGVGTIGANTRARARPKPPERSNVAEFIYQMIKARKAIGDKVILDDVTMSFFPGAKIGMVGPVPVSPRS